MITRNYFKIVRVFPDPSDYFYIKNESYDAGTLMMYLDTERTDVEYKIDNGSWTNYAQTWAFNDGNAEFNLQPNSKFYLRGTSGYWKDNEGNGAGFQELEFEFSVGGDLRTLLNYTDVDSVTTIPEQCFAYSFQFGNLISIDNLTLGSSVTTIEHNAFHQMFSDSQIQKGLDLSSVTTLGDASMEHMYNSCDSLNEAYAPNVSTWNTGKTNVWLGSVAPTGVLYKPANLTIPTNNASGVPSGWTTQTYPQN